MLKLIFGQRARKCLFLVLRIGLGLGFGGWSRLLHGLFDGAVEALCDGLRRDRRGGLRHGVAISPRAKPSDQQQKQQEDQGGTPYEAAQASGHER